MYLLYNLMIWLGSLLLASWFAYRALRGRLPGLKQRLGFFPNNGSDGNRPVAWFHAVSLGEVKVAAALAEELRRRVPGVQIVMTSSTRTGWEEARRRAAPGDTVLFPPADFRWVCRRFLRRLKPNVVLVLETEMWPNLFREVKRLGVHLLLVNGRISDRSFPRYRATRFLWRRVLAYPDTLFAQSPRDAGRFVALGAPPARVQVAGNLKFAARPAPSAFVEALQTKSQQFGAEPVWVAGSTMAGEEKYLLETFLQLRQDFPRLWMVLAPRHPERFEAVAGEVRALGIPLQRRSQWQPETKPNLPGVLLLDSTGELGAFYQLATVAFVGGTLVPTGGHNILEPAHFACPTVIGPSMHNFQAIAEEFLHPFTVDQIPDSTRIHTGAIVQVQDAASLAIALRYLFSNPAFARRLGQSAREILDQKLTATQPALDEIERLLAHPLADSPDFSEDSDQAAVGAEKLPQRMK